MTTRLAIVGENGCGKSTFIKALMQELKPIKGSVKKHHSLRVAYYSQHVDEWFDLTKSAVELIKELCAAGDGATPLLDNPSVSVKENEIRSYLGAFSVRGRNMINTV
eukprot:Pgem_evm1s4647